MNSKIIYSLAGFAASANFSISSNAQENKDQPNILFIMADQQIPFLMGCYGHPVVKTPNLDKLVESGIRFENCYTPNPICAPARASLMSGMHSTNVGAYDNAAALDSDEPTFCHYLTLAGYETVLSGKMHFVGADQMHGFDKRLIPNIYPTGFNWVKNRDNKTPGTHARMYKGDNINIIPEGIDMERDENGKLQFKRPEEENITEAANVQSGANTVALNSRFDKQAHFHALDYLDEYTAENRKDPFFLCVSYNFPHEPFHPPQELWDLYEDAKIDIPDLKNFDTTTYSIMDKWLNRHHGLNTIDISDPESLKKVRRAYYALVTYIDIMIGELMENLKKNGLNKNTIVIYTSDHGDMLCEKGMVQKRTFYEWSSHVPMIFKYPDNKYAGKKIQQPVSLVDLFPTFLDYAGIKETVVPLDGKSIKGLIEGTDTEERYVFSEMHSEGVYANCFMVRKGDYKYIYIHGYEGQLFNLKEDPKELNNLIGKSGYEKIEKELKDLILTEFNPDEIEADLRKSILKRKLVKEAMEKQGLDWDYRP